MEHKQNSFAPEAATDEPASPSVGDSYFHPPAEQETPPPLGKVTVPPPPGGSYLSPPAEPEEQPPAGKVTVPSEAPPDEKATAPTPLPPLLTDFDPAPLRYREDGLTPQRQREYVEALADCGVARKAAARIGVSEQAIARVRRRADARAFDLACEAAHRIGARRLSSIAYERAIEGTVRRHYYHGELKSEEVVFDSRLLIYLLGKTAHLAEPPPEAQRVIDDWEQWMETIEQGLPAPPEAARPEPDESAIEPDPEEPRGDEIWREEDGSWWTNFPPPAGFDGEEEFSVEYPYYRRRLSEAEQAVMDAAAVEALTEQRARETARRDCWFGFAGGNREPQVFSAREAETYGTSVHLPDEADEGEAPRPGSDFTEANCETPTYGVDPPRPGPRITML